jgi:hypothetical protein
MLPDQVDVGWAWLFSARRAPHDHAATLSAEARRGEDTAPYQPQLSGNYFRPSF